MTDTINFPQEPAKPNGLKLEPEVKAMWVAALRSGKYTQGQGTLRLEKDGVCKHCCLGVLCDLYNPELWQGPTSYSSTMDGDYIRYGTPEDMQTNYPPIEVYNWAVIGGTNLGYMQVTIDNVRLSLAGHNDEGRTFAEIADAIEAQL